MVRIPGFHWRGRGSIPGGRTETPGSHMARPKKKKKKIRCLSEIQILNGCPILLSAKSGNFINMTTRKF